MTTAEKLVKIAENVQKVFEAGQKSEYDRFWDAMQNNGNAFDTSYMFCGYYWNDATYNPKYPIVSSSCSQMYRFSMISDVKVGLDFSACTGTYLFTNMATLKRIPKIIVNPNITYTGWFASSPNIEEISFEGTIGKSIDIHWSTKLSFESLASIVGALSKTVTGQTITLPTTARQTYDNATISGAWDNRVSQYTNWTFAYA